MYSRFPLRLIFLAALMTIITLSSVVMVFHANYRDSVSLESRNSKLQAYTGSIQLYSQQLSSSALLAAHSANTDWITKYNEVEPKLYASIQSALKLAESKDAHEYAELLNDTQAALAKIEREVFDHLKNGEHTLAIFQVSGETYRNRKDLFANEIENFLALLNSQRIQAREKQQGRINSLFLIVPLSLALSILLWGMVYKTLSKWKQRFAEEELLRNEAEAEVRAVNEDLESRIESRTIELEESKDRLRYLANHDDLTGLPNRRYILDHLNSTLRDKNRSNLTSICLIDLDNFKLVNDTLGHAAGDELLQQAAERLTEEAQDACVVARLGGDEFLMVANHSDPAIQQATSMGLADNILQRLKMPFFLRGNQYDLPITASIGIAVSPHDGESAEEILRNADIAMYAAKESGKNNACTFKPEMSNANEDRMALEGKLRDAIASGNQFELYYQPQIDLAENRIIGAEALLRWIQPEDGMIGPDKFIPIAEDTGLIIDIGEWVLFEAARQVREWKDNRNMEIEISVNVASQELQQSDFVSTVKRIFNQHAIDHKSLGIEITESSLIGDDVVSLDNIRKLHEMGLKLSMDDFGTGYSALSYLKQYPFDVLKIDRSFIATILEVQSDAALVEGIINMSRNINLKVVAEGTENLEQCDLLRTYGCDIAQGYYYSKPLPAEELLEFIDGWQETPYSDSELPRASGF